MMDKSTLSSGYQIPRLGLGTWQVTKEEELVNALNIALEIGYRHIDTAFVYKNEHIIGKVLKEWISSGKLKREDLFVTSKLPPWGMENVTKYLELTMKNLQLDYLDLYLIHMPFSIKEDGQYYAKIDGNVAYDNDTNLIDVWKNMEKCVRDGRVRSIGVSNYSQSQLERILKNCHIPPSCLQIEHHIYLQQPEMIEFCKKNNVAVVAYSPLGSPAIASFGNQVPTVLQNPVVNQIAKKHKKSPAQVVIRHILQKNLIVIPKSVNAIRLRQNFEVMDFNLDDDDIRALNQLDAQIRLYTFENFFKGVKFHKEYPFPDETAKAKL